MPKSGKSGKSLAGLEKPEGLPGTPVERSGAVEVEKAEKKGINSANFEAQENAKQVIPRRGNLFQFREDYLTCVGTHPHTP